MSSQESSFSPPPRLKDRYRLVEWLGEGSMGSVYRASDTFLERDVAIKFLKLEKTSEAEFRDRFLREAKIIARLSHPNIMTLHDMGQEDDWYFLVLEYIAGQDLHNLRLAHGGKLTLTKILPIVTEVLQALAYAHAQGIIHRDIKPENIMLTTGSQVKVTDFGLSLVHGQSRLTQEEMIVGSMLYLAPEVINGERADQRTDLYAVGIILYELLLGQAPFQGDNPLVVFSQILTSPVKAPCQIDQSIPPKVEALILKLLAKSPTERYPSAEAVLQDLLGLNQTRTQPKNKSNTASTSTPSRLERLIRNSSSHYQRPNANPSIANNTNTNKTPETMAEDRAINNNLLMYAAMEDTTTALEGERRRLAQMLEKQIIESLNLLLAQSNAYEQTLHQDNQTRMAFSVMSTLVRQSLQQTRDMVDNLNPSLLESLGLEPALEALSNQIIRAHGLHVNLHLERQVERLAPRLELVLFRVTQMALERALHQTQATYVTIKLSRSETLLRYQFLDNGLLGLSGEIAANLESQISQFGGQITVEDQAKGGLDLQIQFQLAPPIQLTARELDVMGLLVEGLSNKEIAQQLAVTPRTINFHLDNIYAKLNVNSRTEAAIYALRQGWTASS